MISHLKLYFFLVIHNYHFHDLVTYELRFNILDVFSCFSLFSLTCEVAFHVTAIFSPDTLLHIQWYVFTDGMTPIYQFCAYKLDMQLGKTVAMS